MKYRADIEAGKYKVVTRNGDRVVVYSWNDKFNPSRPLVVVGRNFLGEYNKIDMTSRGTFWNDEEFQCGLDLFIEPVKSVSLQRKLAAEAEDLRNRL